jgi:hypothetical protein
MALKTFKLNVNMVVTLLLVYLVMFAGAYVTCSLVTDKRVSSVGVVDVIVKNPSLSVDAAVIDWGVLYSDCNVSKPVRLTNDGNVTLQLTLSTLDWVPDEACDVLTVGWDKQSFVLRPNQTVTAKIWLYASPDVCTRFTFSFDIVLTGTEV